MSKRNKKLIGFDLDNMVLDEKGKKDMVIISGRIFDQYDDYAKLIAQKIPTYIRGAGEFGDREASGTFKALMIGVLGVDEFYEQDPLQAQIIEACCADCKVILMK